MFGEDSTRKFQYKEMNMDMYNVEEETGKLMYINWVPPTAGGKLYLNQVRSVAKAFGDMCKDSTSRFMKPFLESFRRGSTLHLPLSFPIV